MADLVYVTIAAIAAGLLSLAVAIVLIQSATWAQYLVKLGTPFAAGVLLIVSFRDLLPHGVEEQGANVLNGTLVAILIFFLIEKGFKNFHHHHEEEDHGDDEHDDGEHSEDEHVHEEDEDGVVIDLDQLRLDLDAQPSHKA